MPSAIYPISVESAWCPVVCVVHCLVLWLCVINGKAPLDDLSSINYKSIQCEKKDKKLLQGKLRLNDNWLSIESISR
jgi:hypothetical protein